MVFTDLCRGNGTVLDVGVKHSLSRYWMASYVWSADDISRYDQDKEPPCPVWRLGRSTPVIPVSFLRLSWSHGLEPWCVRSSEYSAGRIASRPPSLIICDLFPYSCARIPHGRFLLPSDSLPEVSYGKTFTLKGPLERYSVDHDDIVDSILYMLDGKSHATLGLDSRPIQLSRYLSSLQDVLQAVAEEYTPDDEGVPEA